MTETDLTRKLPNEKPFLSDVLNFQTDIAPYPYSCLWAGVGAGKNGFVENLINGNLEKAFPRMIILLISSRKSKVLETLTDETLDASRYFTNEGNINDILLNSKLNLKNYRYKFDSDEWPQEIYQRSLVCTNAAIEKYLKYSFDPNNPETHLWNRFDMIIWDEAHSLVMDSTYQSAPYHVMRLFQESYKRMNANDVPCRCKHLILMTGTPDPLGKVHFPKSFNVLDMRDVCRCVQPENIHFMDSTQAYKQITEQLKNNERLVFFANHTAFPDALAKHFDFPREKIAVSFSDDEKRSYLKKQSKPKKDKSTEEPESDYERMENVEKYLFEHESIRPDIGLFYTTSRNKEGINISDKDIRHIYIESHSITDIKQMAGRIRNGAEHIYIIMDPIGHGDSEHSLEQDFAKEFCVKKNNEVSLANSLLKSYLDERKLSATDAYHEKDTRIDNFIDFMKKKTPYLEFDYFSFKFRYNLYREIARDNYFSELETFNDAKEQPYLLINLFKKEFPYTKIHAYNSPEDEAKAYVLKYLEEHPEEKHPYKDIVLIGNHLRSLLGAPKRSKKTALEEDIRNPNHYLHRIGYQYTRHNNSELDSYNLCTLEPYKKTDSTKIA